MKSMGKNIISVFLLMVIFLGAAGCVQVVEQSTSTLDEGDSVDYFRDITKIPRPSGYEDKMREYLIIFAKNHNLTWKTDDAGNLLITQPTASTGATKVILQAHMDMVPVAIEGKDFDFKTQSIPVIEKDGWFTTDGTTLGADDGCGIAIIQSILSSSTYPNLEISGLFTVEEEIGMKGAAEVNPDFLQGDILINLDNTNTDEIIISSAGGQLISVEFSPEQLNADTGLSWYQLTLDGLEGGHSGEDIDKNRGNAICIAANFLSQLDGVTLASFEGGTSGTAIPSSVSALFGVPSEIDVASLSSAYETEIKKSISDKNISLSLKKVSSPNKSWGREFTKKLLSALTTIPDGVYTHDESGHVQSSSNLGILKNEEGKIKMYIPIRSSVDTETKEIAEKIAGIMKSAGAEVSLSEVVSGWKADRDMQLVKLAENTYEQLFSEKLKVSGIHAGVEAGTFSQINPKLEIISAGITHTGAHTPDEKVSVEDLQQSELFIRTLLENIQNNWKSKK